jgi:outer membrane protein assembly factor BamB
MPWPTGFAPPTEALDSPRQSAIGSSAAHRDVLADLSRVAPSMQKRIILAFGVALLLVAGGTAAAWYAYVDRTPPSGSLDTNLEDVKTTPSARPAKSPRPAKPETPVDGPCWTEFGGDPQRSLARVRIDLGVPTKSLWARAMGGYMEYPPSYCDGRLYVNTYKGTTYAVDAATGRVIWRRNDQGPKPSTPAIAGPRVFVSSTNGSVTALDRSNGKLLWRFKTSAKIESSPLARDGIVYFGATDGRLFAVNAATGHVKWAYDTGGRINSSPSLWGNRLCITTYAGSIFCLDRRDGRKLWSHYYRRDFFRYDSFYASPSTDGKRIFTVSRSGKVYAVNATNGRVLWTGSVGSIGYTTPAISSGRVFVGGFDGYLRAYSAANGTILWRRYVPGRILGGAVVVGDLVFFSTLETDTYAARVKDGKIVWHIAMGKYSPGIATNEHYYFSLNGILVAFRAANTPK